MEKIIKKKYKGAIKNRYSFPTTDDMKKRLDELKNIKDYDINEMFRRYAERLIATGEDQSA
jgi:hypothetical protein